MTGTRIMPGLENLTGRTIGTLRVGEMVERHPQPRYRTTCSKCSAQSTEIQSRLTSGAAGCRNGGCGKPQRPSRSELVAEQRRQAAEREAQRLAEDREASELRMAAECDADGYERPVKYTPTPSHYQPMTERERLALRERREAEEQEHLEADRPRLEAERKAAEDQKTAKQHERERSEKQKVYWAEWVQNDRDPKLFVSDAMRTASMSQKDADNFNSAEVKKFIAGTKEYAEFRTPQNADHILEYLSRNGVRIADVATFHAAFVRLRDLGILEKKPEPQPVEQPRRMNLNAPSNTGMPKSQTYQGWDENGVPTEYSEYIVSRWSSEEMRRRLRLQKAHGDLQWLPIRR